MRNYWPPLVTAWLIEISISKPRLILGTALLVTALLSIGIPQVRLELDARSLVSPDQPSRAIDNAARALFGLRDTVVIAVKSSQPDIFNPETLNRVRRLTHEIAALPGIARGSVKSIATIPAQVLQGDRMSVAPLIGATITLTGIQEIRRDANQMRFNDGVFISKDDRTAAIYAEVADGANRYELLQRMRLLVADEGGGTDRLWLSGTAAAQAVLGLSAARDLLVLLPFVIVLMSLSLWLCFRRLLPAVVSLSEILLSLLCTIGLMGLSGNSIFVTALVLPVVIIAVGVSDDMYALSIVFRELADKPARPVADVVGDALFGVAPQICITAFLTIVGLLSFAVSGVRPIRMFGLFGALAIGLSTLATFTVVPAMLVLFAAPKRGKSPFAFVRGPVLWMAVIGRVPPQLAVILVVILGGVGGWMCSVVEVNDSWISNLPTSSDVRQDDEHINQSMAGTTILHFLLEADHPGAFRDPKLLSQVGELERKIGGDQSVGAIHSIRTELRRVQASLDGREVLMESANLSDLSTDADVEQAYLVLGSAPGLNLQRYTDLENRRICVTVFLKNADYRRIGQILRTARQVQTESGFLVTPFGDAWLSYITVQMLVEGQFASIVIATAIDFFFLWLLLRSLRFASVTVLPVLTTLVLTFAGLAVARVPLGIANSLFAAIALGIGFDFAVHLAATILSLMRSGSSEEEAIVIAQRLIAPAIVSSSLSISAGLSVLLWSEIAPNVQLGALICSALLLCAALTLILLPACLHLSRRRVSRCT